MTPVITAVRLTGAERPDLPLLILGPSLGTSVTALWSPCAAGLAEHFDLVGWDLPGHGHNPAVPEEPLTMTDLARGVLAAVEQVQERRGESAASFRYAGVSVGGAVGLQLLLDAPDRMASAALLCTGAQISDPATWAARIEQVRTSGTAAMVSGASQRWFGPGFLDRAPAIGSSLLESLQDTRDEGYAAVCAALADFDVRDRLGDITAPVLAVAGAADGATPPAKLAEIATGVRAGRLEVLEGVAHLAPAERPERVVALLRHHLAPDTRSERYHAGLVVRREVLGDAHVERATANATDFTRDFQELITEYAWGEIWTRPGLDRRSRSLITLTALVARGHHEELAMHVRAALRNGLSVVEIKELLLQAAIYCGVPDANTAFRVAQQVLADEGLV